MAAQANAALAAALTNGPLQIGQVLVRRDPKGNGFVLSHIDDDSIAEAHQSSEAALEIARFDSAGNFRPLKTAPNLRRGWLLQLRDLDEVDRALDFFYPGRLPALSVFREDRLLATSLRESLSRQTGMYRSTANISDEQIDEAVFDTCRSDGGCLRTILWKRDQSGTIPSTRLPADKFDPAANQLSSRSDATGFMPLLCQEACAVLLEACRRKVRKPSAVASPNE